MWQDYFSVTSIDEALQILAERGERARIIAGGTDLILEIERKVRSGIETLIDVTRIPQMDQILLDEKGVIHLGPLVTHSHCVASPLIRERAFPLAQAAIEVGVPQIRNRGTVAGNLITASPANDTIVPLMALDAKVTLRSLSGERVVPLNQFYTGVRGTVMRPDEMMVDISFAALQSNQRGAFIKLGLRRAQAISLVSVAVVLTFEGEIGSRPEGALIRQAAITLGAVAPTVIHADEAEAYLTHRALDEEAIGNAASLAQKCARPIDDVRGSKDYRMAMVKVITSRALRAIMAGKEREGFPAKPITLWGRDGRRPMLQQSAYHRRGSPIIAKINGKEYTFTTGQHKTLLRLLREEAGLIGTKEGCDEGECGACTVFLDGMAVMSCLVPAVRAHGAEIVTVEGVAKAGELHPVQRSFIERGAVQCGYCTPGFVMSAVKLLEETSLPTRSEIEQAISGNLCRCTGYYKIVQAIEGACRSMVANG